MPEHTVWAVAPPKGSAKEWGVLKLLSKSGEVKDDPNEVLKTITRTLVTEFKWDDYLLLAGPPILNAVAVAAALRHNPVVQVLWYDPVSQGYQEKVIA